MATITTINASDAISDSRTDINSNFTNLNSDKIETSVIDTDTALAANSDAKIPSQKAVKAYTDALGNVNASTTSRGIVEEATAAEMIAGTAAGGTGARLFLNPSLVAETGTDKIVKTKSTGLLDSSIVPLPSVSAGGVSKDISSETATTIAHGLGTAPSIVRLTGYLVGTNLESRFSSVYVASTQVSISSLVTSAASDQNTGTTFLIFSAAGTYTTGTITVDATNITISWAKTGSPTGTAAILWDAQK